MAHSDYFFTTNAHAQVAEKCLDLHSLSVQNCVRLTDRALLEVAQNSTFVQGPRRVP